MRMKVVSIEGHIETTTLSDCGPTYLQVQVNLEGNGFYSNEACFYLPLEEQHQVKIGDEYEVAPGSIEKVAP